MNSERILVFGTYGTGKTYQGLKLASWLKGSQFYVLDTDDSYPRSLESFLSVENVHVTFAYDWEEYVAWLERVLKVAVPGRDWLVVDRLDKAWARAQNYVSEEVYGQSLAERLLEVKKRMKGSAMKVSAVDRADWQVINAQYLGWQMSLLYKSRCNVYLVTSVGAVSLDDDEQVRMLYGALGVKPEGQKSIAYEPHTVLYFSKSKTGGYLVTTVKDRGERTYFDKTPLVDLAKQYLLAKAGFGQ